MAEPWVDWDWVGAHGEEIIDLLGDHVTLTAAAVSAGLILSFPLALAVRRWRRWQGPVLSATGALYAIPSLALFALLLPWTGLTRTTALIALISYTLLILVRNIVAGLDGVAPEVTEAATAMGMHPLLRLVRVELPLALPAVVADEGGHGGLGQLILDGLNRDFRTPLVVGSVLSVALAAAADVALVGVQRLLTPWARRGR